MENFQALCELIPESLAETSGAVFNTGPMAFNSPAKLYVLGLNPGGAPQRHLAETVSYHTRKVLRKPPGWAEYRDEQWDGRPPGAAPLQRRVLHALGKVGIAPGTVPMSNVIFKRTSTAAHLGAEIDYLADICWPFHRTAIERMGVKIILCFGKDAASFVRSNLSANELIDDFVESNGRKYVSRTYANKSGISVISATHPGRFDWCNPHSDPTPLLERALQAIP